MESSCTICFATTRKPNFASDSATAGPETSTRSPCAQESLTVSTAAVYPAGRFTSIVEEDIFLLFRPPTTAGANARTAGCGSDCACAAIMGDFLGRFRATFPLRFVKQSQAFHQQALRIELRGFLIGFAVKVELEVATRPAQNFEDRLISKQRAIGGVLHLSLNKKDFALLAFVVEFELAALAAHFQ